MKAKNVISMLMLFVACSNSDSKMSCSDFEIRGAYIGASNNILQKIQKLKKLNMNAVVIDIRNEDGEITCDICNKEFPKRTCIKNIKKLLQNLKSQGIYTIARIVTFRNKIKQNSHLEIKNQDGSCYVDNEKMRWLNPYDKRVFEYIGKIVIETAKLGFDEIQFDYIRLPQYKSLENTSISYDLKKKSKVQIINEFLDYIVPKIHKYKVKVSVDVFGCVIPECLCARSASSSKLIGQDFKQIIEKVDYICPMIYPSHWPVDSFGIEKPDLKPYDIVKISMEYAKKATPKQLHKIRPWIQAFSASWLKIGFWKKYGIKELQEQIDALKDVGIKQYCFWNPSSNYNVYTKE